MEPTHTVQHRQHRALQKLLYWVLDAMQTNRYDKNDDGPDALEMAMQAVKKKEGFFVTLEF